MPEFGMEEHYDSLAEKYDDAYSKNFGCGYPVRFETIAEIIKKHVSMKPWILLDVCGGNGTTTKVLCDILGVEEAYVADFSKNSLDIAEKRGFGVVHCDVNSAESVSSMSRRVGTKMDIIFVHWSIHHCKNIQALVDNLAENVLEKNGIIVVVAEHRSKFPGPDRVYQERNAVYEQNIRDLDGASGGKVVKLVHKEFFDTGKPWKVDSETYADITQDNFLTFLHDATEEEKQEFCEDIQRKDFVEIPNSDYLYIFQKC